MSTVLSNHPKGYFWACHVVFRAGNPIRVCDFSITAVMKFVKLPKMLRVNAHKLTTVLIPQMGAKFLE